MITVPTRAGARLAIFGLGGSGLATGRALVASGAKVSAWDDDPRRRLAAGKIGVPLLDLYRASWARIGGLVLAPGIPLTHPAPHPVVELAQKAHCPVIGDIELFAEAAPAAVVIGITGTNGKSTTTALVGHVLQGAGRAVQVGGNLGTPALALEPLPDDGAYVLELSSYQLDLTAQAKFDVAVLVNISPDHLDRHGGMDGYVAAKRRIFRRRGKDEPVRRVAQTAVVGMDDDYSRDICDALQREGAWRVVPISGRKRIEGGVYVLDGVLHDETAGAARAVMDLRAATTLPGLHNWQNAAAAYAAARAAGASPADIARGLTTYPGLPHRQERIGEVQGVAFINDSKATNGDSAANALACYEAIYWIAGGKPKDDGLGRAVEWLQGVRRAYLIGEAAERFEGELKGKVKTARSGTLARAMRDAFADARKDHAAGAVVLLSPACASFDQFANFEARGEAFRAEVAKIAEEAR
jgi:UDP-N-acetylmuramoylalanine--D-glutamate ligase